MNKKILLYTLLFSAATLTSVVAEPLVDGIITMGEYQASAIFDDDRVRVSWTSDQTLAWFAISAPSEGWVALGFGAESMMQGADMAIGWVANDGTVFVLDCFSTGPYGPHPPDTELGGKDDLIAYAAIESEGRTTIEFSRPLSASEANDKPIVPGEPFLWAYGPSDDFDEYHPVAGYGTLTAPDGAAAGGGDGTGGGGDASSGTAGSTSAAGAGKPATAQRSVAAILLFVLPHALPLVLSFLLMTVGMLVARYGKKNKKWLAIHKPLGAGGALLGIVGLGFGIRMVALSTGMHFRVPHAWLGATALVFAAAAPILGQAMFKVKKHKAEVRKAHRLVGRLAIILMAFTIISGLLQSGILG